MTFSTLFLLGALAAAPDVVGADAPQTTRTFVSERGDPESAGDTTATCRVYEDFAVVVFDAPMTKGIEGVEVRDRSAGVTAKALCAKDFAGPTRKLMAGEEREYGYFFAVKGPIVLMRGDDGFGAHDRLAIYRASDGALVLDTTRFDDRPARLLMKSPGAGTRAAPDTTVELSLQLAIKVGCDPRSMENDLCLGVLRRDNGIPDDVAVKLDGKRACRGVDPAANVQLGLDAVITVDAAGQKIRFVGGDVVCAGEP